MLTFKRTKAVAIGEDMTEMAPIGEGSYRRGFAGGTFNTAWHMAQALGAEVDVGFLTRVGQDRLSEAFISELAQDGMDVSKISRDPDRTMGLYMIELDGVERSFSYWRNASAARLLASDEASISKAFLGYGLIHLSGITLAIFDQVARSNVFEALENARANGSIVSFDPNIRTQLWASLDEISKIISRFLNVTDLGLPSFDDETGHWGDADSTATIARLAWLKSLSKTGVPRFSCYPMGKFQSVERLPLAKFVTRLVRGMRSARVTSQAPRDHPFPRLVWID